jgi:outer membrane protein insertion porin family
MHRPHPLLLPGILVALAAGPVLAQPGTIEEIQVQGLYRMHEKSLLHKLGLEPGAPYDLERIRERFRALWELGLFKDLVFEVEDGPGGGKILVVKVQERETLASVVYEQNKVVTQTQIEDTLKERGIQIGLGKPIDLKAIGDVAAAIRELLASRGFQDASVSHKVEDATETSKAVTFSIRPGRKTRIRNIDFTGNQVFKDRALKKQLRLTKERRWWWPWSKKNLYHPLRWDTDSGEIRGLYQNRGYLDVELRGPIVELRPVRRRHERPAREPEVPHRLVDAIAAYERRLGQPDLPPGKRKELERRKRRLERRAENKLEGARRTASGGRQWVSLTVPVTEGPQYRMGQLTFSGNSVFTEDQLRSRIPLREGVILSEGLLELGVRGITRAYEDRGYLYADVVRRIHRRQSEPVADVHVAVSEDKPYRVARIEFRGNTTTKDGVLRRELHLEEGELFNRSKLELSRKKLNQLGWWVVRDEPTIEPVEGTDQVRIRFKGEEQSRNEIQVGGGYSGLDGVFFSGVYSTRNFLGRGQVLSTSLQVGGRADRYAIGFTEPWFLNRPYTLGARVFRQDVDYGVGFTSSSKGGGLVLGRRLGTFSSLTLSYSYESVSTTTFEFGGTALDVTTSNQISSVAPAFRFNTVDSPYRPSRGSQFSANLQVAGGPFGGDTSFLKPILSYTTYKPLTSRRHAAGYSAGGYRTFAALNLQAGLVRAWRDGSPLNTASVNDIPRFQRFWLGGDTLGPRVFETRTITPRRYIRVDERGAILEVLSDPTGVPVAELVSLRPGEVGGDQFYLMQAEYVRALNEQVDLAVFLDAGDSLFDDATIDFDTARVSAGIELRLLLPVFPVPLRLIYGVPVRKLDEDRTSNFQFSIGRSF